MFKTRITIHTYVRANVSILDSAYFSFPSFHFLFSSPPLLPLPLLVYLRSTRAMAEKTRDAFVHLMALVVALLKDTYVTSPHAEICFREPSCIAGKIVAGGEGESL